MSFQAGDGQCPASPAGWVLAPVPSPPRGFLQQWGLCPDPAPCGFVNKAGVFVGWLGEADRSFSPEGSAVTHRAALLSHGFISGYTNIRAGAQEAICLHEKVIQMFFIWGNK